MLEPSPRSLHAGERHQHADRQHQDGDQRAADVEQEQDADQRDDDAFLDKRALERLDGRLDEVRAVVDRHDLDALGQAGGDFGKPRLHALDDVERVLAEALQDDAAGDLALAVELGDAAALVGAELDPGHVLRRTGVPPSVFRTMLSMSATLLR